MLHRLDNLTRKAHHVRVIAAEASEAPVACEADVAWPHLLLPTEAATLLRINRATVYRYARDGVLASVRVGRCVRIRSGSVRALMDAA
jgi:excisionase family DNA binding protein